MKLFENKRAIGFERSLFFFFFLNVLKVYVLLCFNEWSCILCLLHISFGCWHKLSSYLKREPVQKCGPRLIYFGSDTSNSGSKICTVHTMPSYPLISIREAWDILAEPQLSVQLGKIQDTLSFHLYGTTKSRNGLFLQIPVYDQSPTFIFFPPHDHIPVLSL